MDLIRWFDSISLDDAPQVGGKGANLGELTAAGLPVPPGFVITSDAFLDAIDRSGARQKVRQVIDSADPDDPATQAYRARIRTRFAELHDERERLEAQLKALAKTTPAAADTSLLDQLPLAGDVLPRLPPRLKARLFQVFDISVLWNKPAQQATVNAEITETTLRYLAAILDPSQDGFHDTHPDQPESVWDLTNTPRMCRVSQPYNSVWGEQD